MAQVIVIGANGETRPYAAAGIPCFEPGRGRLIERVLAERVRCEVLGMTRAAFGALPMALARELQEQAWPALAIVPNVRDTAEAARVAIRLLKMYAGGPVAA